MLPRPFEYVSAQSVGEAISFLARYGRDAKLLAGGQSLIPLMKLRLAAPKVVVDINRVAGLGGIQDDRGGWVIGALTRHREMERATAIQKEFPILGDTAVTLADPLVRNQGTVGGALAHADPASDWGTTFLALGAQLELQGPKGPRRVLIDSFFRDAFLTVLAPNEILTKIHLAHPGPRSGSAYSKLKRKTGDFATAATGVALTLNEQGGVSGARIALAAAGPTPIRAPKAEQALMGDRPDVAAAAQAAARAARPPKDLRGGTDYKTAMVEVHTYRAIERALERARGRKR